MTDTDVTARYTQFLGSKRTQIHVGLDTFRTLGAASYHDFVVGWQRYASGFNVKRDGFVSGDKTGIEGSFFRTWRNIVAIDETGFTDCAEGKSTCRTDQFADPVELSTEWTDGCSDHVWGCCAV